ncbi:MAG: DUF4307 domain-containing protein [Microbacteriaceae bacterium]|nr:DUF4307 domain-containing protein [Microbacteriaceae bacterium]
MSQAPAPRLESRYGRTPVRRGLARLLAVAAGAGVLVVAIAWAIWVGLLGPAASLESRTTGYVVVDDSTVEVRYEVTVDAGRTVSCAVQALNSSFETVGWRIVELPASEQRTRSLTEVLRTTEPAVTGLIYRCWLT